MERLAKRILLVGWDAADWNLIHPLMEAGKMPALLQLVEGGVSGNIATLQPCLSPILWTSIATGKLADKHCILGFIEPDGAGGVRASTSTTRKTRAVWNILSQAGLHCDVIGWYASHPAELINGVCVSNAFDENPGPSPQKWPLPAGSVHPGKYIEPVTDLRVHPSEILANDLVAFVPRLGEIDWKTDKRPAELARCLAHTSSVHAVATAILENEPWDLMAVYYDMMDTAGHVFMPYFPPRMDHVPKRDFEFYSGVMAAVYQFHDQMLARLIELAGPETTVIVVSDHGFYSDHRRPRTIQAAGAPEATAAAWHRQFGMLCMAGPGIRRDERIHGSTLLDITPTILAMLGLPVGADMDGRLISQALETDATPEVISSWDDRAGEAGMHSKQKLTDSPPSEAVIDRLVNLGYLDKSSTDASRIVQMAQDEADANLASVYENSFRPALAVPILERLFKAHPENARYGMMLASVYAACQRSADARGVLESLEGRGFRHPDLDAMLAQHVSAAGDPAAALERLNRAGRQYPASMTVLAAQIRVHLSQRQWKETVETCRRALAVDSHSLEALNGMAGALVELGDFEGAAEHAMRALTIAHYFPAAHYNLGAAMEGLGLTDRAIQSYKIAVQVLPSFVPAHRKLAALFAAAGDHLQALRHERAAEGQFDDGFKSVTG